MASVDCHTVTSVTLAGYSHMALPFWLLLVPGPKSTHLSVCLALMLESCKCFTVSYFLSPGLPTPVSKPVHYCLTLVQELEGRPLGSDIWIFHHSNQGSTNSQRCLLQTCPREIPL